LKGKKAFQISIPMTGIFDKYLSYVDMDHIMGR